MEPGARRDYPDGMKLSPTAFAVLAGAALAAGAPRRAAAEPPKPAAPAPAQETPGLIYLDGATIVRSEDEAVWLADPSRAVRLHSDSGAIAIGGVGEPEVSTTGVPGEYALRQGPPVPPGGDFVVKPLAPGIVIALFRARRDHAAENEKTARGLDQSAREIDEMLARDAASPKDRSPELAESFGKLAATLRESAARNRETARRIRRPRFIAAGVRVMGEEGGSLYLKSGAIEIQVERGSLRFEPGNAAYRTGDIVNLEREPGGDAVTVSTSPAFAE
jgi:hypothetical protein